MAKKKTEKPATIESYKLLMRKKWLEELNAIKRDFSNSMDESKVFCHSWITADAGHHVLKSLVGSYGCGSIEEILSVLKEDVLFLEDETLVVNYLLENKKELKIEDQPTISQIESFKKTRSTSLGVGIELLKDTRQELQDLQTNIEDFFEKNEKLFATLVPVRIGELFEDSPNGKDKA